MAEFEDVKPWLSGGALGHLFQKAGNTLYSSVLQAVTRKTNTVTLSQTKRIVRGIDRVREIRLHYYNELDSKIPGYTPERIDQVTKQSVPRSSALSMIEMFESSSSGCDQYEGKMRETVLGTEIWFEPASQYDASELRIQL